MTTSQSPLRVLKAQADQIAAMLKKFERGEKIDGPFAEKLEAAREKDSIKIAVVMDDKVLTITIPWATLRTSSQIGMAEFILKQMRGARDAIH